MKCCMEQLSGAGLQGGKVKGLSFKGLFKSLVFLGQFPETVFMGRDGVLASLMLKQSCCCSCFFVSVSALLGAGVVFSTLMIQRDTSWFEVSIAVLARSHE